VAGGLPGAHALEALAQSVGERLRARGARLVTAESCTGGGVAWTLTGIPGASAWFDGGIVAYDNRAKTRLLGVPPDLIAAHGAVSEPVARAMAQGALTGVSGVAVSLSITGIAGPDGGTAAKPVGTVCLAWCLHLDGAERVEVVTRHFPGGREAVRRGAIAEALRGLVGLLDVAV
jgi:nicotinamide-nucleotide amidase